VARSRTRSPKPRRPPANPTPTAKRTDAASPAIEALFAELERDPTDEGATLVLADALAELGDVRAELVHVQHALATAPKSERANYQLREKALLHGLRTRLLGPKLAPQPDISLEVRLGFARELGLVNLSADELADVLATVLPSPDARLLESLQLAWDSEQVMGVGDVFRRLAGEIAMSPALRRLKLGNAFERDPDDRVEPAYGYDDDNDQREREPEDLRTVLTMFPRLRELVLDLGVVPVQLAPLATNRLEALTWITPRLAVEEIEPLARSVLPKLRRFELWIGAVYGNEDGEMRDEDPGDDLDVLEALPPSRLTPVLAMLDRCAELRELAFGHCDHVGSLLDLLREHPCVGRLETLTLSQLAIDDAGELVDFMRATPSLQKLVLDDVHGSDRTRDLLERRLGPRLVAEWASRLPRFRYVTGYE
jgi:uncharacterized protein (TIGR02996 family)